MRHIRLIVAGLTVESGREVELSGLSTELVTVKAGGFLVLKGTAAEGLRIEAGGRAFVSGTAAWVETAGRLELFGTITEFLVELAGAEVTLYDRAMIRGERVEPRG